MKELASEDPHSFKNLIGMDKKTSSNFSIYSETG